MKNTSLIISFMLCLTVYAGQAPRGGRSPQEEYIARYADMAVEEMYRSGVPASITLAQGMLESRYGLSELAVEGNNHFGIKCHNNWSGKKMYHDDDRSGECFRKYPSVEHSYRDHSDFLRYRQRYSFLFDYPVEDYKAWAHGLKKAGYATDPSYPSKLINLIEEYRLYEYDRQSSLQIGHGKKKRLPEAPSQITRTVKMTQEERTEFSFSISRDVYRRNGVPFVYSAEGESYESIAAANNLFVREILRFNDLKRAENLLPGTVVYLQPKKKQAVKGQDKHVVEDGESMRDIAQKYGLKMKNLYKLNAMADTDVPREGDIIKLRK